jgi:hypothetical protein
MKLEQILGKLERHYGKQKHPVRNDSVCQCGYPANEISCPRGYDALRRLVGLAPDEILDAPDDQLAKIMRLGGIVPELRAQRRKEIASRVRDQFGGDLHTALEVAVPAAKKILKQFPTIGDPGADSPWRSVSSNTGSPVEFLKSAKIIVSLFVSFGWVNGDRGEDRDPARISAATAVAVGKMRFQRAATAFPVIFRSLEATCPNPGGA